MYATVYKHWECVRAEACAPSVGLRKDSQGGLPGIEIKHDSVLQTAGRVALLDRRANTVWVEGAAKVLGAVWGPWRITDAAEDIQRGGWGGADQPETDVLHVQ